LLPRSILPLGPLCVHADTYSRGKEGLVEKACYDPGQPTSEKKSFVTKTFVVRPTKKTETQTNYFGGFKQNNQPTLKKTQLLGPPNTNLRIGGPIGATLEGFLGKFFNANVSSLPSEGNLVLRRKAGELGSRQGKTGVSPSSERRGEKGPRGTRTGPREVGGGLTSS